MSEWFVASGKALTLPSLLFAAESESWTAQVDLAPHGSLTLVQGQIVAAKGGGYEGLDGLFELFILEIDTMTGSPIDAPEGVRPLGDMARLTFEGVRRADEWSRLEHLRFSLRSPIPADADEERARILRLLDAGPPLRTVCELAKMPRAAMAELVSGLLEDGTLSTRHAPVADVPQHNQVKNLDYYDCIDAGRTAFRAGRHDDAIAAFQTALDLRPGDRVASQNMRRVLKTLTGTTP